MLAAIAANTAAEPSAHEAIRVEQDRAASIATLAAEADTIATHAHHTATAELLVAVLGDTPAVQQVIPSDDFPRVVTAVRGRTRSRCRRGRSRPRHRRPLQAGRTLTARALADTLHHASPRPPRKRPGTLVAGLIPDATPGLTDPTCCSALRERYALIEQRADALLDNEHRRRATLAPRPRPPTGPTRNGGATPRGSSPPTATDGASPAPQPLGPPPDATAPHAHHADHRRAINALALHHSARGLGNPIPVPAAPVIRSTSPRSL